MTRPRAVVVVTGSELVRGDRTDLNGPYLAAELLRLGIEPARIVIVGDREDELADALGEGLRADLCVVSGGLGPTHDDRTVELVARAAGVGLRLDEPLHDQIGGISRRFAQRLGVIAAVVARTGSADVGELVGLDEVLEADRLRSHPEPVSGDVHHSLDHVGRFGLAEATPRAGSSPAAGAAAAALLRRG